MPFVDTRYIGEYGCFHFVLCKNTFHDRWVERCQVSPHYKSNSWVIWIKSHCLRLSWLQHQIYSYISNYLWSKGYFRSVKMAPRLKWLPPNVKSWVRSLELTWQKKRTSSCVLSWNFHMYTMLYKATPYTHTCTYKINQCKKIHFIVYITNTSI